ncbi:MAG: DUF3575 domain-containing protein, partial [Muribaculaceae bacterium]|nr:DUF3575 domain-containing protein [Muribaculaceae bacterium]
MKLKKLATLLLCLIALLPARGQDVALQTNLLYDAVLTPHVGVE